MLAPSVVPTVEEVATYLSQRAPAGWDWESNSVRPLNVRPGANHWTFTALAHGKRMVVRLLNPNGRAARSDWLHVSEECLLLSHLNEAADVGPRAHWFDRRGFRLPVFIQEFIEEGISLATLRELGGLTDQHLEAAANLIGHVSAIRIQPMWFPMLWRRRERSYRQHIEACHKRFVEIQAGTFRQPASVQTLLMQWREQLSGVVDPVAKILGRYQSLLNAAPRVLIFKGAHLGNTLWEPSWNRCRFVDWESVARGDPAFTLARFIMDLKGPGGPWPRRQMALMADAYRRVYTRPVARFEELLEARLLERELADAVWVLREEAERERLADSNEEELRRNAFQGNLGQRFKRLQQLLAEWPAP